MKANTLAKVPVRTDESQEVGVFFRDELGRFISRSVLFNRNKIDWYLAGYEGYNHETEVPEKYREIFLMGQAASMDSRRLKKCNDGFFRVSHNFSPSSEYFRKPESRMA